MKTCPIASRYTLLFLLITTVFESNAIPLAIRRPSFDRPFPPASPTSRHALISSRMLALLPRNHESQYANTDTKYSGEGYRGEEGSSREPPQDDSYGNKGEIENIGMSRDHRHSSSGSGDWNEGTSATSGGSDEGEEDEQYGPDSNESPEDSEANLFPSGYPNAPTKSGGRPEHNHQVPGNPNDTFESDEVPASPQMNPTEDQPHESNPVSHQGKDASPEEATLSEDVAPSSSANEDDPSMVCSTLSRLYQRLDGPAWHNQEGWKDTTVPRRMRTRDHEGSRESQHSFKTTGQMEAGPDDGRDEGQVGNSSIDRDTTSDRNENPMVVKEDSSDPPCCSWFGVTCRRSRVVGLALAGNGLEGPYPTDIVQSMVDLETV